MIKKSIDYVSHGIWEKKDHEYKSKTLRWLVRQFKVLIFTARGVGEHSIVVRSAALTFYTLMSLVPILALIFGIVKGFGLEKNFNEYLYGSLPQYTEVIDLVIDFANNLLMRTKGGIIASVGFVVLIWSVMKVFGNIESAFNHIWEVKRSRSITRKFSDYVTVVFIAPILFIISNSLSSYLRNQLEYFTSSMFLDVVFSLASVVAMWTAFAFVYYMMPNTKVKVRSAFTAGIIAGTIFMLFQVAYIYIQTWMTMYNAIYGSFAALPLFLIWLQASWQIVLMGAELSFAYQNIHKYEQELQAHNMSYSSRRKVIVATMAVIIRHFTKNDGPATSESVADELNLPVRLVRDVIFDLENAGQVLSVATDPNDKVNMYVPAKDIHKITLYEVVNAVEDYGTNDIISVDQQPDLKKVSKIMDKVKLQSSESPQNILLMDLI